MAKTQLKYVPDGTQVRVWLRNITNNLLVDEKLDSYAVPVIVLAHTAIGDTYIGTKENWKHTTYKTCPLESDWVKQGIVWAHLYGGHCYCDNREDNTTVSASTEAPCKQCGRNNFVGEAKCWWCSTAHPC